MIRKAEESDSPFIAEIYNHYIDNTVVTFEEEHVTPIEMRNRIIAVQDLGYPFYVYESNDGSIAGYAYAGQWKNRSAYRYAAEVSIYLNPECVGSGIGSKMYQVLIQNLKEQGIHSVMGGIALPNAASIALHEKLGFVKVAHFKQLGWKQNRWIDVGYWELDLGNQDFPLKSDNS